MHKFIIITILIGALLSPAQGLAATPKEKALAKQVQTLKRANTALRKSNRVLSAKLSTTYRTLETTNTDLAETELLLTSTKVQLEDKQAQVNSLTGQVNSLTGQVSTLTAERDSARASLSICQNGALDAVKTMSTGYIFSYLIPQIHSQVNHGDTVGGRYATDHFSAYDNGKITYENWSFTDFH